MPRRRQMRRRNYRAKRSIKRSFRRQLAARHMSRTGIMIQKHAFKRMFKLGTYTASVSAAGVPSPISQGFSFAFNQLPGTTDFTTLFDQYKINGIKFSLAPTTTEAILSGVSGSSGALGFRRVHTVLDFDDASAPTGENQMLEYQSRKTTNPMQTHSRYWKPTILTEQYRSAVSTAYAPQRNKYLDLTYTDVPHYGLKLYVDAPIYNGVAAAITYEVFVTYYFTCKNVR